MTQTTRSLCDFLDASPTSCHATDNIKAYLSAHGALALDEREPWNIEPGATYYLERGSSALIAFRPGLQPLGTSGYILAGAHTDSPCLKVRPDSERNNRSMLRIAVEVYGGAILSGWLDRPLALAGRVILRDGVGLKDMLYNSGVAVGVIPNLPIHLNREINKGVEYNAHQHLPVLVDVASEAVVAPAAEQSWLKSRISIDLGIPASDIVAMDLSFHDSQKAAVFGRDDGGELINAPRLDDLAGCHAILEAFCSAKPGLPTQIACFLDAEEIGSMTALGANSSFMRDLLARLNIAMKAPAEDFYRAGARSLCISVDAAQAWNPAYTEKFDETYSPLLGKGPAVKMNANQRYATDIVTESLFKLLCDRISSPWQKYMSRADIQPGTTIGPISASRLGVRAIDIGHPLLAMHAVRETIEGADHRAMIALLREFFRETPDF
ncbi:MAG TPA: M18 family aminopeptidase [Rectinemataceae bacterium]|nr:M18 family aminopeptidase [Rectinemataceae bacterium]